MKRVRNNAKAKSSPLIVTARFDHSWFLPLMIEELANANDEVNCNHSLMQENNDAIRTSTLEAQVSGNFVFSDDEMHHYFSTGFLFTCMKSSDKEYQLCWSNSLS